MQSEFEMSEFQKIFKHSSCYEERKETWIDCLKWAISQKVCRWEADGSISTSNMIKVSEIEQELKAIEND